MNEIKIKLKESLNNYKNDTQKQNNVHIYQIRILVQNCNLTTKPGETVIIQVSKSFYL